MRDIEIPLDEPNCVKYVSRKDIVAGCPHVRLRIALNYLGVYAKVNRARANLIESISSFCGEAAFIRTDTPCETRDSPLPLTSLDEDLRRGNDAPSRNLRFTTPPRLSFGTRASFYRPRFARRDWLAGWFVGERKERGRRTRNTIA